MNFNASPRVSAVGELATTQGDARSPSAYFRSPFNISFLPLPIFLFQLFFPPLTLGPNELHSLVAIGGQMCCRSCQCSGTVCAAKKKRKKKSTAALTHRGHCQLIKNSNNAQECKLFRPTLISPTIDCPFLSCSSFSLSSSSSSSSPVPRVAPLQPAGISSEVAQCRAFTFHAGTLRSVISGGPQICY